MSAVTLDMLETPAAVVDLGRMERNLQRAADYTKQHDLAANSSDSGPWGSPAPRPMRLK
jgi:D-serine deaminase-like pyridoxal phosphate-dependent protein